LDNPHTPPPESAGPPPAPSAGSGATPDSTVAVRLREAISALRNGDRASARAIFQEVADEHPTNENGWIGLAISAPSAEAAASALRHAETLNPNSRFVAQAEADLTRSLPGFAEALAAEREAESPAPDEPAPPPAPVILPAALSSGSRLGSGKALQGRDSRARRILMNFGLGVASLALIALAALAVMRSPVFGPAPPTTPPAPPTAPPATAALPTTAPAAHVPPTLAVTPTLSIASSDVLSGTATAGPAATGPQAAIDAVLAGRYAEAIPALEAATERQPGDAQALYYLGVAYLNAPDRPHGVEDATLTFRSLQALHPRWAPGLDMLARSLLAAGQYRDAVTPAHQAVESDPGRPEYWMTLGQAYDGAGAKDMATAAYAQAARLSPGGALTPAAAPSPSITATGTLTGTPGLATTPAGGAGEPGAGFSTAEPAPSGTPPDATPGGVTPTAATPAGAGALTPAAGAPSAAPTIAGPVPTSGTAIP
jgi:Flp pilus assembly protein TadD